jgi:RNA polymerase sigma factor (sigma-70 family)
VREPRRPGGGGPRRRDLPDRLRRARALRPATTTPAPGSTASPPTGCGATSATPPAAASCHPGSDADFTEDALGRVEARALGSRLAAALRTVAAADRDALLLLAWAELTYAEIAHATGIPVGTVRSRIHNARTQLCAHLDRTHAERA